MLGLFKKRAAERSRRAAIIKEGEHAGQAIFEAVEAFLNQRLPEVSKSLLEVLRGRFNTIYDHPPHAPKDVAQIEWNIFNENIATYPARLRDEIENSRRDWLNVATQMGVRAMIDQHIEKRIADSVSALRLDAIAMLVEVVEGVERKGPHDASGADTTART